MRPEGIYPTSQARSRVFDAGGKQTLHKVQELEPEEPDTRSGIKSQTPYK